MSDIHRVNEYRHFILILHDIAKKSANCAPNSRPPEWLAAIND